MKKSYYTKTYLLGILIAISALLFPQQSNGQAPPIIWQRVLGGTSSDFPGVGSESKVIRRTSDGGYLVGGYSSSGVNGDKTAPNKGANDYWVVKLNGAGNKVWDRTYGGNNSDVMTSMTESPGGGFLLAGYSFSSTSGDKSQNSFGGADYWIVKIDDNGNKEWDRTIGGTSSEQHVNVIATNDGGYLLTGSSASGIGGSKSEVSRGGWDYWVVKITAAGMIQWDRTFGGTSQDWWPVAVQSPDGGYLISGHSSSPAGQDKSQNGFGSDDYWLVKISSTGAKQWDRTYGGTSVEQYPDVAVTSDGGYLIVGDSPSGIGGSKTNVKGGWDFWMIKINAAGALLWDKSIGGNGAERRPRLDRVASNEFIISGLSQSSQNQDKTDINFGGWDYWVVNIDGNANINWDKTLGATSADYARGVVPAHGGGYVVHGMSLTSSIGSGNKNETGRGNWDYWVVQLDGSGCAGETVPPTITCPADLAVSADANCESTLPDLTIGATVSDNCSVEADITVTQSPAVGTVIGVGTTIVTLTATDEAGNTATCTVDVTVEDDSAPQAICQDITIQLDAAGNASITAADIDDGSNDNCGITSLSLDKTAFTCADVGVHAVTLTATDAAGLTSSCQANVTVEDNVAPVAVCQDITIQLQDGTANIQPQDLDGGSSDACGIGNLSLDNSSFTCANVGVNVVVLIVTDQNGNVSTCSATVTVEDNEPPVIVEPDDITVLTDAGECGHTFTTALEPIVTDDCGVATITGVRSDGLGLNDPFPVGETTIDWSATDVNGNASAGESITFMDQVISNTGQFSGNETLIDFQGLPIGGLDPAHFAAQGVELELVNGARAIVVRDLSGPPDSRILANSAIDDLVMTFPEGVNRVGFDVNTNPGDDVNIIIKANGQVIGSQFFNTNRNFQFVGLESSQPFDELILDVTETVNGNFGLDNLRFEGAGSGQFVSQVITVEDNESPTAVCQDLTIQLDPAGSASITPQDVDAGSTDNCGIASISLDNTGFTCADVGANLVTLTVTDIHGNSSTCTATVTVEDMIAPTITKPLDQLVPVSDPGVCGATVDFSVTADDNCGIASLDISPASGTVFDVGTTTVTITATDANGNVTTDSFTVTVFDSEAPMAVCQDLTIQLDAAGNASITPQDVDAGSTDNCGIAIISLDNTDFTCADVGANLVTLTVTDIHGNSSTCTATVTVKDLIAPTINKPLDQLVPVSDPGVCGATVDFSVTADDNCGIASLDISPASGTVFDVGTTTVTITATDANGNVTTDSFTVTVFDSEAPTAVCQDLTIQLDAAGSASITPQDVDNGSTDNCGIASISLDNTGFTCADVGANLVTLTVTDIHGNSSTCTATVTVEDMIAPTINKPLDQLVPVSDPGVCGATVDFIVTADDNCGIASLDISPASGTVFDVGTTTVTITATDVNGNLTTDSFTVTVFDSEAPTAVCQDLTIELDAAGSASITPQDVDAGSTDNCGIGSISLDNTDFTCADAGANLVTLTVTDIHGNSSTCTATVTVVDLIAPTITKPLDQLVPVSDPGVCGATVDFIVTADDNCGIASLDISPASGTVFDVGTTTVTITATDFNGNVTTDSFTVTVFDSEAPTAVCQDLTIQLDEAGSASITLQDVDGGSTDNCGIASISVDKTDFGCADVGANLVTLTVVDIYGNSSSCTSTVTVEDNTAPVVECQDITVVLGENGTAFVPAEDLTARTNLTSDNWLGFIGIILNGNFSGGDVVAIEDIKSNIDAENDIITLQPNFDPSYPENFDNPELQGSTYIETFGDLAGKSFEFTGHVASNTLAPQYNGFAFIRLFDANWGFLGEISSPLTSGTDFSVAYDNSEPDAWIIQYGFTVQGPSGANEDEASLGEAVVQGMRLRLPPYDNCTIATIESTQMEFDCSHAGDNIVTLTVTDVNGNATSCDATVTIVDKTPPVAVCQDITIQLDASGNAFITPDDINNGSSDACGIDFIELDRDAFGCNNVGQNQVTLTLTDIHGNSSSCTALVTVEDITAPELIAPDPLVLTGSGLDCGASLILPTPEVIESCGLSSAELLANGETLFDYTFVPAGTLQQPRQLIFGPDGNLYVGDLTFGPNGQEGRIMKFDGTTGATLLEIGGPSGSTSLAYPRGLDFGPDGNLYVSSSSSSEVLRFDPNTGTLIDAFVPAGTGGLAAPTGLVFGPDGDLYVVDRVGSVVRKYDATTGAYLGDFVAPGAGGMVFPIGLTFGPDGNLYVASFFTNAVHRFDGTTGAFIDQFVPSGSGGLQGPEDVEFGPDGDLYVTSFSTGQLFKYDGSTGAFLQDITATGIGLFFPDGLTFGPDGHLYASNTGGDQIVRYPLGELDLPYGVNDITFNVADRSGNTASVTYTVEVEDDIPPVFDPVSDLLMPTFDKSDGRIVEYDLPTATDNCDLAGPPVLISGIGSGGFFPIGTTTEVYEVTDINGNVSTTSFVVTVTTDLGIVNFDLVCADKKDKYANEDKGDYGKHKDKDDKYDKYNKCDGNVIRPLRDGDIIDAADPATSSISIVANVSRKAGSVAFYLDGELVRIDNYKEYSITGNKKDIFEFNPTLGTHTLTAIPYSKKDGEGDEGIPLTITFTVINTSAVTSFNLFETDKYGQTLPMTDGQVIDVAGGYEFTIEAVTDPAEVGSVLFLLNGEKVSIDNDNIYLLENPKKKKGKDDDDDDYGKHKDKDDKREKAKPFDWAAGDYTLTAIPFEDEDMCGTSGTSATITFTIVNSEAVTSFAIVDEKKKKKDEDEVLIPLEDGDIVDIDDLRSKYRAIQAFTNPDEVGSVVFYLDGEEVDTDYKAPYLTDVFEKLKCKDSKKDAAKHKGDKYDISCILGEHTLTAVPYSQKKGEGVAGTALTITFEVVQSTSTREELDSEELAELQVDAIQSVVYPNPVVDKVSLSILSPMEDGAELAVIDLSGKVLHKQSLELRRGNNEVELDLVELNVSVGTVLLKVSTHQQGTMIHRLMKR